MGHTFENYCYENTDQVEEAIEAITFWPQTNEPITSANHLSSNEFNVNVDDGASGQTYQLYTGNCQFENNKYPPLIPVDVEYVGLIFTAILPVIALPYLFKAIYSLLVK